MKTILLAGMALVLSGCAVPVWVTATSVTALAGTGTALLTFDTEALKVLDDKAEEDSAATKAAKP